MRLFWTPGTPEPAASGTQIVTVLCPKGGTGKTTVATNVAVALATRRPGRVVLVDLDLAFGDVASALLLDARQGLREAAAVVRADDQDDTLQRLLLTHPSGLRVLPAPDAVRPDDLPAPDEVQLVLAALSPDHDVVVVDTGAGMDAATMAAVAMSTDLVLVGSMDVPTLLGLRKAVHLLDELDAPDRSHRYLVLNRAGSDVGLTDDDVEVTVGCGVTVAVPSDGAVTRSVNEGRQVVDDPDSVAGAALRQLADTLLDAHARTPVLQQ